MEILIGILIFVIILLLFSIWAFVFAIAMFTTNWTKKFYKYKEGIKSKLRNIRRVLIR